MTKVLIIGAGGVATVAAHKCAQNSDVFNEIIIASRTKSKCDALAKAIGKSNVATDEVDADNVPQLVALFKKAPSRSRYQFGTALPRPFHHGRMSGMRHQLYGYRQL